MTSDNRYWPMDSNSILAVAILRFLISTVIVRLIAAVQTTVNLKPLTTAGTILGIV